MIFFYRVLSTILYPVLIILIFFRRLINKEDQVRYKEKIFPSYFDIKKKKDLSLIWFHAASIGELKSILPVISHLNKKNDNFEFLITTMTLSSSLIAKEETGHIKNIQHRFFPVDVYFIIEKFINLWSPKAIFLVDSEIWPNLIFLAKKKKIPIGLLNARITKKTFKRWGYIKSFGKKIFSTFGICLSSNKETVEYLKELNANNIIYIGNLKFANSIDPKLIPNTYKDLLENKKFWLAASTHKGEEMFCLKTHIILKKNLGDFVTIIAPRHIDRVGKIKELCESLKLKYQILNKDELINNFKEIIIINSFGVLSSFFKFAKCVFIGKSVIKKLQKVGGQNPLDAALLGCKIYHGPYIYNFKEVYDILRDNKISKEVNTPQLLAENLLNDIKNLNYQRSDNSRKLKELNQKTFEGNMTAINDFLSNEII